MTNIVVLIGRLARPVQIRQLPSGDVLAEYQLTVPRPGVKAESVPVVLEKPPASATEYGADTEIVVVGRVRRRFFRIGGRTESRTEVVADAVLPVRQVKKVRTALASVCAQIEEVSS